MDPAVKNKLGSLLFTLLMFLSVPPYALLICLASPFGHGACYTLVVGWVKAQMWLLEHLTGLTWTIDGQDNLPSQPAVVFLKHSSALETLTQILFIPRQTWVLKRELMWAPFLGWALMTLKPIAINRGGGHSAVDQVVHQGKSRLEAGLWICVFPEGTRMPAGATRRYGISGTLLAQQACVPVIPVAHDAGFYWPRRGWTKTAGTARFVVGPPMDPTGRDPREFNREVQTWIENKVRELRSNNTTVSPPDKEDAMG